MNLAHLRHRIKGRLLHLTRLDKRLREWDDERYLKLSFRIRMGKRLNLVNPETFSEKLQWLKLHDRQPIYTIMVDKHAAKAWVAGKIGSHHIVPSLGVWNSFDEINFDALPRQFVLKCTHDSGGLVICKDRSRFDLEAARAKIETSLARNYFYPGREWPYLNVPPRVLAEVYFPSWNPAGNTTVNDAAASSDSSSARLADSSEDGGVIDYKFYCFHGEPKFLYVSRGLHNHTTAEMNFLTLDWTPTDFQRPDYLHFREIPPRPQRFEEMISIAQTLSTGIPFVRVDLFEHADRVLFSEMTFHPVSGMMPLAPKTADREIGRLLDIGPVDVGR